MRFGFALSAISWFLGAGLSLHAPALAQDFTPMDLHFERQAAQRFVFDDTQSIRLAELDPATVVGLEVMHPTMAPDGEVGLEARIERAQLVFSAPEDSDRIGSKSVWVGGFNPFATTDVQIGRLEGSGNLGLLFASKDASHQLRVGAAIDDGQLEGLTWRVWNDGNLRHEATLEGNVPRNLRPPLTLRVQLLGSGFMALIEKDGRSWTAGVGDFSQWTDWRDKALIRGASTQLDVELEPGAVAAVDRVWSGLTTGVGQADIHLITLKNGQPFFDDNRLWFTMSVRGRTLPQHLQGVFSLDPSVFDVRLEGIIVFDRGDGLLRNEIASHLFYDPEANEWRGWTTGFSTFGDPDGEPQKEVLAVHSRRDPRFGFSIMQAEPMGMVGNIEDPSGLWDAEAQKWRLMLCVDNQGYKATMFESDDWNGPWQKIAGPVEVDSTGTALQKIGDRYYCFFGSAEKVFYVYSYPDLRQLGTLDVSLPPWNDRVNSRVWANIVPLPPGYPARYMLLTHDRFNFPGITGANWSYGAVYQYHADHPEGDFAPFEYE